jgi:hypothetical protein
MWNKRTDRKAFTLAQLLVSAPTAIVKKAIRA